MRLTGLYWHIDRWRKSTAYTDMTLEQQGAYRNLLDEAWLRGGTLPDDERVLAKACGDAMRWSKIRAAVMGRFTLTPDGWQHETLTAVLEESRRRADKQREYRETTRSPVVEDPEVRRMREQARGTARRAVKAGLLIRQPCEVCGRAAHMHHDDYAKPLEVRWLCPAHHRQFHDEPALQI